MQVLFWRVIYVLPMCSMYGRVQRQDPVSDARLGDGCDVYYPLQRLLSFFQEVSYECQNYLFISICMQELVLTTGLAKN